MMCGILENASKSVDFLWRRLRLVRFQPVEKRQFLKFAFFRNRNSCNSHYIFLDSKRGAGLSILISLLFESKKLFIYYFSKFTQNGCAKIDRCSLCLFLQSFSVRIHTKRSSELLICNQINKKIDWKFLCVVTSIDMIWCHILEFRHPQAYGENHWIYQ